MAYKRDGSTAAVVTITPCFLALNIAGECSICLYSVLNSLGVLSMSRVYLLNK